MKSIFRLLLLAVFMFSVTFASGQFNVGKKIENKVNNRINNKIDRGIDKGLDGIEKSIKGDKKQENKTNNEAEEGKDNTGQDTKGDNKEGKAGLEAYSKYDFVPGEKVIFFEDFSQDAVGDFPALWNTNGSAEVVTTNLYPGNWMKFVMNECVWTDALLKLPENYTVEFDVIPIGGLENANMSGWNMRLMQARNAKAWDAGSAPGNGGIEFSIEYFGRPSYHTWLYGQECEMAKLNGYKEGDAFKEKINQKYHIAIWVQKSRVRIYQNQDKLFDAPKAFPTGCVKPDRLRFEYGAAMISNVRVAVGAPDMRNKLMTEGKLVTYGIYFDVNKDVVKPESYGTLKEIAAILNEVPDVKVKIVGHTDSDGADASNLDLSKRRAASVKNELVKSFNVNGDRLVTDGMGESQPVAPNDTPANKALNRRVEFIKM
ncbi:MAG TPA: OmpA family protein [Bacteroidales bacterium]|nr:OmpA family protein [Bacteroidales bacterium]HPT02021.1 OmpA family protein [Bacteroidales bacterium]